MDFFNIQVVMSSISSISWIWWNSSCFMLHYQVFGEQDSPQIAPLVPAIMAQGFTLERLGCNFWNIVPSNITLSNYQSNFMGANNTVT